MVWRRRGAGGSQLAPRHGRPSASKPLIPSCLIWFYALLRAEFTNAFGGVHGEGAGHAGHPPVSTGVSPSKQTPPEVPPCQAGAAGSPRAWGGPIARALGSGGDTLCRLCSPAGGGKFLRNCWDSLAGGCRRPWKVPGAPSVWGLRPTGSSSGRVRVDKGLPGDTGCGRKSSLWGLSRPQWPQESRRPPPTLCPCLLTLNRGSRLWRSWGPGSQGPPCTARSGCMRPHVPRNANERVTKNLTLSHTGRQEGSCVLSLALCL